MFMQLENLDMTPARHLDMLFLCSSCTRLTALECKSDTRNSKEPFLLKLHPAPSGKSCTQPFAQPLPANFWSGLACRRSPAALRNPMWNEARYGPGENMATTGGTHQFFIRCSAIMFQVLCQFGSVIWMGPTWSTLLWQLTSNPV